MKIGIFGVGFVGGTHLRAFEMAGLNVSFFDIKFPETSIQNILGADIIFVCLPTPTSSGQQNTSIILNGLRSISTQEYRGVVCLKSTVLPGTTRQLRARTGLRLIHSPEFLREKTALGDFISQTHVLLGGPPEDTAVAKQVYQLQRRHAGLQPLTALEYRHFEVTELAKYMHNSFLALKVSYANQYSEACRDMGILYGEVLEAASSQGALGLNHMTVPGPDGQRGYSGSCFPKDISALIHRFPELTILSAAHDYNQTIRPHDDDCRPLNKL